MAMKLLLLLLVILIALGWVRARGAGRRQARNNAPPKPQAMVPCAYCSVHVPSGELLPGLTGFYCCDAHRRAHGDRAP